MWVYQVSQWVKNLPALWEIPTDLGSIPGPGRSPGGGHGDLIQYSCLENRKSGLAHTKASVCSGLHLGFLLYEIELARGFLIRLFK